MSKGSTPRPFSVSDQEYADRWDAIFGKVRCSECGSADWRDMRMYDARMGDVNYKECDRCGLEFDHEIV